MKIGILTHHFVNNFGAFLQAYALRDALAEAFPDDTVEIIDYYNIRQFVVNTGGWFRFYRDRENLRCWTQKIQVPLTFWKARKTHMTLSRRCYCTRQVNQLNYDVIVVGSDEVWNYQDWRSMARIKYGHGLTCPNLIAYAPSVGDSHGNVPEFVVAGIKKFSALSSRDDATYSLLESITGTAPKRVVDPTFLSAFPNGENTLFAKPYILFYYCDRLPEKIKNQVLEYAKSHNLKVYGAGECDKRYTDVTVNLSPFSWVDAFRNAEFVFTGTFHGAVFSILNHRPFKVYLTNKSRVAKVASLLTECGLTNREIESNFSFDLDKMKDEIDYAAVDRIIDCRKKESMSYIVKSIEQCRK